VVILGLFIGYFFIEPLRESSHVDTKYDNRSLISITSILFESVGAEERITDDQDKASTPSRVMRRLHITLFSAAVIHFDQTVGLDESAPDFLTNLILQPIYSVIPRVIWPDKPMIDYGRWFTKEIYGHKDSESSTSLGPIGHLYLVGGALGVCLGFWAIGIAERMVYVSFWRPRAGSLLVYLVMIGSIARTESTVDPIIVTFIRILPMLIIFQFFLYKRSEAA
jgi:hypothetical protein